MYLNSMAYGTRRFDPAFTKALNWFLSLANWFQFISLIFFSLKIHLNINPPYSRQSFLTAFTHRFFNKNNWRSSYCLPFLLHEIFIFKIHFNPFQLIDTIWNCGAQKIKKCQTKNFTLGNNEGLFIWCLLIFLDWNNQSSTHFHMASMSWKGLKV